MHNKATWVPINGNRRADSSKVSLQEIHPIKGNTKCSLSVLQSRIMHSVCFQVFAVEHILLQTQLLSINKKHQVKYVMDTLRIWSYLGDPSPVSQVVTESS